MLGIATVLERVGSFRNIVHVSKEQASDDKAHMNADFPSNGLICL
jgi:hypothetical protein